jgi:hypothetical protein
VLVAWADAREGGDRQRIYYQRLRATDDRLLGPSGAPLLATNAISRRPHQAHFMPQLAIDPSGTIGCAFYEYGPKRNDSPKGLIDVQLVISTNRGRSFRNQLTVTDWPWDPSVDLVVDENRNGFIGDYFGLTASTFGFFPLWTDTRTRVQEIFNAQVVVARVPFTWEVRPRTLDFVLAPGSEMVDKSVRIRHTDPCQDTIDLDVGTSTPFYFIVDVAGTRRPSMQIARVPTREWATVRMVFQPRRREAQSGNMRIQAANREVLDVPLVGSIS